MTTDARSFTLSHADLPLTLQSLHLLMGPSVLTQETQVQCGPCFVYPFVCAQACACMCACVHVHVRACARARVSDYLLSRISWDKGRMVLRGRCTVCAGVCDSECVRVCVRASCVRVCVCVHLFSLSSSLQFLGQGANDAARALLFGDGQSFSAHARHSLTVRQQ